LLTLRAVRLLRSADIILFDEGVSHAILDFARREARKLFVGNAGTDDQVAALMNGLAGGGKRVVKLCVEGEAALLENKTARDRPTNFSAPAVANSSAIRNGAGA
jgi:siroheme synthase